VVSEPLVVALALEPAATRVTLWQGGARRLDERIAHGALALAGGGALRVGARRELRAAAVRELLGGYSEDARRPDAFVVLGAGAAHAGVYGAVAAADDDTEAAALAFVLAEESGARGLIVEPIGSADAALAASLPAERVLLARAIARRDAFDAPGTLDGARIVVSLEEEALVLVLAGDRIVAAMHAAAALRAGSTDGLIRRMELGDAAVAETVTAYVMAASRAVLAAARAVPAVCSVLLTGSLAQHACFTDQLSRALHAVAPVRLMPAGRVERALAEFASAALIGLEPVRAYG
jgi:hypothetical protein